MSVRETWEMECPECKEDTGLMVRIVIHTEALLTPDGTDDQGGDHEWDDDSECHCVECGWSGVVADAKKVA